MQVTTIPLPSHLMVAPPWRFQSESLGAAMPLGFVGAKVGPRFTALSATRIIPADRRNYRLAARMPVRGRRHLPALATSTAVPRGTGLLDDVRIVPSYENASPFIGMYGLYVPLRMPPVDGKKETLIVATLAEHAKILALMKSKYQAQLTELRASRSTLSARAEANNTLSSVNRSAQKARSMKQLIDLLMADPCLFLALLKSNVFPIAL